MGYRSAGTEGRAIRDERAGAQAEVRAERWRHVLQRRAAIAATVAAEGAGEIGAEPVAARFTLGIDALHGPAGKILHISS